MLKPITTGDPRTPEEVSSFVGQIHRAADLLPYYAANAFMKKNYNRSLLTAGGERLMVNRLINVWETLPPGAATLNHASLYDLKGGTYFSVPKSVHPLTETQCIICVRLCLCLFGEVPSEIYAKISHKDRHAA